MPYIVEEAPDGYAVDTDTKLTAQSALALAAARWKDNPILGVGRYVSISSPKSGDVDYSELQTILAAGLACWPIQHVREPGKSGWTPSAQLGTLDGLWASRNVIAAGFPAGVHVEMDLEGVNPNTPRDAVKAYASNWAEAVDKGGNSPLLYDGYSVVLTPEDLWELPDFHLYCADYGGGRVVPNCGFAMNQEKDGVNVMLAGTKVDIDKLYADQLGRRLKWMKSIALSVSP